MTELRNYIKWLTPGIGVKRWIIALIAGSLLISFGILYFAMRTTDAAILQTGIMDVSPGTILGVVLVGLLIAIFSVIKLSTNVLEPYRRLQEGDLIDVVYEHRHREKGIKLVAVGGGTGLPIVLKGMKPYTRNITAVVTVADDGGSSGRLRRDMGVLPPGDLRNNIVALADDSTLLTQLFQYRFPSGDLEGHAFGNLFIAALEAVANETGEDHNSLAEALIEVERVLNIRGRVLPATLEDVQLTALLRLAGSERRVKVRGESQIGGVDGFIEEIEIQPSNIKAYPESVQAILDADMVVIGPGSLYTSILPNLLVRGIADALRATNAYKVYVCNVAMEPVETKTYSVAEHVMALERHIGRGIFQVVIANDVDAMPDNSPESNYVQPVASNHEILQRYELRYTDMVDSERIWRHDPKKLALALLKLCNEEKIGDYIPIPEGEI